MKNIRIAAVPGKFILKEDNCYIYKYTKLPFNKTISLRMSISSLISYNYLLY